MLPFTSEDIAKMFNPETYLSMVGRKTKFMNCRYWIPLIGLFTGCRMSEICQIHVRDERDGIWCFNISVEDGDANNKKRLKNKPSSRVVPIHPVLLELDFLQYVDSMISKDVKRLFPNLREDRGSYIK